MREGDLRPGDFDETVVHYHLYVQFLAHEQLAALSRRSRRDVGLALDLPLGVHPAGYDVWAEQETFVRGVSAGAPPDPGFPRGQNWNLRPMHPEKIREQGHRYFTACIRHLLRFASVLRIDHVMSLHRLFWIPDGMGPGDGVYVRYPAEELYAVLCLESHRHRALIVGEDLGTVPPEVPRAMSRHGLDRMFVVQYEALAGGRLPPVPPPSVASINTHDMPPFASFWRGRDIAERVDRGLLDPRKRPAEERQRQAVRAALTHSLKRKGEAGDPPSDIAAVLRACIAHLAASPARLVLVNLEDLWHETQPQNVPGTGPELPNWRRKARHSFEEFTHMEGVVGTLEEIDKLRKTGKGRR